MHSVGVHATRRPEASCNRCYVEFLASGTYAWESLWECMLSCGCIGRLLFGWYKEFDERLEGTETNEWVKDLRGRNLRNAFIKSTRIVNNSTFELSSAIFTYSTEHHLFSLITVMPAVPRLLNRVYDKINNEIRNSAIKRLLFRMALKWVEKKTLEHDETLFWASISFNFFISSKEKELRRGIIRKNSFWDKLVFKKVQDAFGGSLRLMVRL